MKMTFDHSLGLLKSAFSFVYIVILAGAVGLTGVQTARADLLESLVETFKTPVRPADAGLTTHEAEVMTEKILGLLKERKTADATELWLAHCETTPALRYLRKNLLTGFRSAHQETDANLGLKVMDACGGSVDMSLHERFGYRYALLRRAKRMEESRGAIRDFANALRDMGPESTERPAVLRKYFEVLDNWYSGDESTYKIVWSVFWEESNSPELFMICIFAENNVNAIGKTGDDVLRAHDDFIALKFNPSDRMAIGEIFFVFLFRKYYGYDYDLLTKSERAEEVEHILEKMPEDVKEWTGLIRFRRELYNEDAEGVMRHVPVLRIVRIKTTLWGPTFWRMGIEHNDYLEKAAQLLSDQEEWEKLLELASPLRELEESIPIRQGEYIFNYFSWRMYTGIALLRLGRMEEALELIQKPVFGEANNRHHLQALMGSPELISYIGKAMENEDAEWERLFHFLFIGGFLEGVDEAAHARLNQICLSRQPDPETFVKNTLKIFKGILQILAPERLLAFYLQAESHYQMTPLPDHHHFFVYIYSMRLSDKREDQERVFEFHKRIHAEILRTKPTLSNYKIRYIVPSHETPESAQLALETLEKFITFQTDRDSRLKIISLCFSLNILFNQPNGVEEADRLFAEMILPALVRGDFSDEKDLRDFLNSANIIKHGLHHRFLQELTNKNLAEFPPDTLRTLSALASENNLVGPADIFNRAANAISPGYETNKLLPKEQKAPVEGRSWISPATQMEFVWIQDMGLWVGKYEVTNKEYRHMKPKHDSRYDFELTLNRDRQPVVNVIFDEVVAYARWMTERDQAAGVLPEGLRYRLPTKREFLTYFQVGKGWNYAWGNNWPPESGKAGNYRDESWRRVSLHPRIVGYDDGHPVTAPVEESWANPWGLYGVGGNVSEVAARDKTNSAFAGTYGGSYYHYKSETVNVIYDSDNSDERCNNIGFRLILSR